VATGQRKKFDDIFGGLVQSTNVTGGQTLGDSNLDRANAWRRAAKTKDRHKSVECISQCDKMTSVHLASQK